MAASYSDMYPKRKSELDDITNHHKKARLDKPYYGVQERLPLPTFTSPKKVSFADTYDEKCQKGYEPLLLTPKDDDYASEPEAPEVVTPGMEDVEEDVEDDMVKEREVTVEVREQQSGDKAREQKETGVFSVLEHSSTRDEARNGADPVLSKESFHPTVAGIKPLTEASSVSTIDADVPTNANEPLAVEAIPIDTATSLDTNGDYIALCASGSLLADTRRSIEHELVELQRLRAAAQDGTKLALVEFYVALLCRQTHLPRQHRIVRAPTVDWGKYHRALLGVALDTNDNENVFTALNVFR